jgi:DNA-binding MarR family transcriptional regulator
MVTTGAMTKRLDRLVEAGLATRRVSQLDGRGRVVGLTAAGRALIDGAFTAHVANEKRLLALIDDSDAANLEAGLRRWLDALS